MTTTTTNLSAPSRNHRGVLATIRAVFGAFGDAYACRNRIEALQRKTDSELAAMGLTRGEITAHAFRQSFRA